MKRETNDCIKTTNEKEFIQVTFELCLYALSICYSVKHFKDIKNCKILTWIFFTKQLNFQIPDAEKVI